MRIMVLFFLLIAALFEVGGDAIIGAGIRTPARPWVIVAGSLLLVAYGCLVNQAPRFDRSLDLGKLLGSYVAVFAVVATFWPFRSIEDVPPLRWLGLALIVAGGIVMQLAGGTAPALP